MLTKKQEELIGRNLDLAIAATLAHVNGHPIPNDATERRELVERVLGERTRRSLLDASVAVTRGVVSQVVSEVQGALHVTLSGDHQAIDDAVTIAMTRAPDDE